MAAQGEASNASQIAGLIDGLERLNGSNYVSWKEKLEITLVLLNIDYALHTDAPEEPAAEASEAEKKEYQKKKDDWEQSNRKCLMIIKSSITESIRGAIPEAQSAREYLAKVEHQFKGSSKAYATSLIQRLIGEKYTLNGNLREHIMKKCNMAAKLKTMEMDISDGFLVHFIMASLPREFDPFVINYLNMKEKWGIDELMGRCVQEEERLKAGKVDYINQFKHSEKKKYKKFMSDYTKPNKSIQFKKPGQFFKKTQEPKSEENPNEKNKGEGCRHCGKSGHIRKNCLSFMRWLNKKGIKYEEDPKKRGKKD